MQYLIIQPYICYPAKKIIKLNRSLNEYDIKLLDTVGYIENNHLTECGSYVYFLLFSDNINNEKMEKSMILLHHLNYKDARLKMKYTPR